MSTPPNLFHVAPRALRERILTEGLRGHSVPERRVNDLDRPKGTYMWEDPDAAEWYAKTLPGESDIWQVNTEGLDPQADPYYALKGYTRGEVPRAWVVPDRVEADRVKLHHTPDPNDRQLPLAPLHPIKSNILDPIHEALDPRVWDKPEDPLPHLRDVHHDWLISKITQTLKDAGYTGWEDWLSLVFTGSLTTYQYSDESDVDISLFVDVEHFPDWDRAKMIGVMVQHMDGTKLPGTPHPLQCFVVPPNITRGQLYAPGLRSGYDLFEDAWVNPPEKDRVHDVAKEMNGSYAYALEVADKMERLLQFEPDKAVMFWHQIHKRRRRDQQLGKGDFAESNIAYKMLANRGIFPKLSELSGEYIAHHGGLRRDSSDREGRTSLLQGAGDQGPGSQSRAQTLWSSDPDDESRARPHNDHIRSARSDFHAQPLEPRSVSASAQSVPPSSFPDFSHSSSESIAHSGPPHDEKRFGNPYSSSASRRGKPSDYGIDPEALKSGSAGKSSHNLGEGWSELSSVPAIADASGEYIASEKSASKSKGAIRLADTGKARVLFQKFKPTQVHPGNDMPFIYEPNLDTVFLGPPGTYHWDLLRKTPELKDQYPAEAAWTKAPFLVNTNHMQGRMTWPGKEISFYGNIPPEVQQRIAAGLGGTITQADDWEL